MTRSTCRMEIGLDFGNIHGSQVIGMAQLTVDLKQHLSGLRM